MVVRIKSRDKASCDVTRAKEVEHLVQECHSCSFAEQVDRLDWVGWLRDVYEIAESWELEVFAA